MLHRLSCFLEELGNDAVDLRLDVDLVARCDLACDYRAPADGAVAGAVGNGIDRLFMGYVTDFISFDLINFPVFNIADCYITVCMFLMVILILFYYKDEDFTFLKRKKADTEDNRADSNEEHE